MSRVGLWMRLPLLAVLAIGVAACGQPSIAEQDSGPATVEEVGNSGLSKITLTQEAAERIGIDLAEVNAGAVKRSLAATGEVLAATGASGGVSVRVSLNAGDFTRIDDSQPVRILPSADNDAGAVLGYMTRKDQAAGYGDGVVYYAPIAPSKGLALGDRPRVQLPLRGSGTTRLSVPYRAVLYDSDGGTWVYTSPQSLVFIRVAVKVDYVDGEVAVLADGPPAGTQVVTVGVTELYGAEVGVDE
jgi:hypothetical protein